MTDNKKFVEDALKAHNEYRHRHKVEPLKLSREVTAKAQKWADHLASTGTFQHCNDRNIGGQTMGENIAMKWASGGGDYSGRDATNQWYSEVSKYNYGQGYSSSTGHFTQVVWKGSKEFGIGRARGRDGKWLVVGNYVPAGNMMGNFPDNVFPSRDGNTSLIEDKKSGGGAAPKPGAHAFTHSPRRVQLQGVQGHRIVTQGHQTGQGHNITIQGHRHGSVTPVSQSLMQPRVEQKSYQIHYHGYEPPTNQQSFNHSRHGFQVQNRPESGNRQPAMSSGGFSSNDFPRGGFSSGFSNNDFPSDRFQNFSGFDMSSGSDQGSSGGGRVVSKQTKTMTEGSGANRKTKTIVTETIQEPDGTRRTVTTETVN